MVLDKNQSAVLWAKPHLDLTNELIRRYNLGEGAAGAGGPPGQPVPTAKVSPPPAAPGKK
jgi:hypothetical protein